MKEVMDGIIKILENNGFERMPNGDMARHSTGCLFYCKTISSYKSVLDFQLEWGYA